MKNKKYYEELTKEVETFAKTINKSQLLENINTCEQMLKDPSIDEDDKKQLLREQAIYTVNLNEKLGIFPGSGVGIQKL
jgi:hypothetical protein